MITIKDIFDYPSHLHYSRTNHDRKLFKKKKEKQELLKFVKEVIKEETKQNDRKTRNKNI